MTAEARLAFEVFDPAEELARFIAACSGDGAVASFVGIARDRGEAGGRVLGLFLDYHPRLTQASMVEIGSASAARFGLSAALIVHRCRMVMPGEPIVLAAAASAHRRAAFDAVDYMMDRLKTDAVFWKREDRVDGSAWIEPRQSDRADRARWSDDAGDR